MSAMRTARVQIDLDQVLTVAETFLTVAAVFARYGNRTTAAIRSLRAELQARS